MQGRESLRGGSSPEQRRKAAAMMGSARTQRKAASSRANGRLAPPGPGMAPAPLLTIPCIVRVGKNAGAPCPGGESLSGHHWSCPRGQAIKRRLAQGRDVWTGKAPASQGGQA